MARFTIVGEYWDSEHVYIGQVEAKDKDAAIAQAQNECLEALNEEQEDDKQLEDTPLKIWAVLAGWPKILNTLKA